MVGNLESVAPIAHCLASLEIYLCTLCGMYSVVDRFQYTFEILSHLGARIVVPRYLLYLIWSGNDEN